MPLVKILFLVLVAAALQLCPANAHALTYTIKTSKDSTSPLDADGDGCTFRKQIQNLREVASGVASGVAKTTFKNSCPSPIPQFTPEPHIIDFAASVGNIALLDQVELSGKLELIIDGDGIVFKGGNNNRIFSIKSPGTVIELFDVVLRDGNAQGGGGGAILVQGGRLMVRYSKFIANTAGFGGAIATDSPDADIDIATTSFIGNTAAGSGLMEGGAIHIGGGKAVLGKYPVQFSMANPPKISVGSFKDFDKSFVLFENNTAVNGGGAIRCTSDAAVTVSAATFSGNTSHGVNPKYVTKGGGAILNGCKDFKVVFSVFKGNSAGGFGGAIYNEYNGMVSTKYVGFNANFSFGNAADGSLPTEFGGGAIATDGALNINQSSFFENSSGAPGGAIRIRDTASSDVVVANSTFSENLAAKEVPLAGAAVAVTGNGYKIRLYNNTVINNIGSSAFGFADSIAGKPSATVSNNILAFFNGAKSAQCSELNSSGFITYGTNIEFPAPSNGIPTCFNAIFTDPKLSPIMSTSPTEMKYFLPMESAVTGVGDPAICGGAEVLLRDQLGGARGAAKCSLGSME